MYFLVGGESGNFSYAKKLFANKVTELFEIDHLDDFLS